MILKKGEVIMVDNNPDRILRHINRGGTCDGAV